MRAASVQPRQVDWLWYPFIPSGKFTVDLDAARLRVDQQLLASGEFGPPKSRRSERTIALDADTIDALRRHIDTQALERALAGPAYEDHDLVFCDQLGRPLRPRTASAMFVQHRKAAKIPVGSMHVLRHTSATIGLTEGVPLHVVAARLGDDPKTVLATYAHLLPQSDAEAAVVAAAIVDKPLTSATTLADQTVD